MLKIILSILAALGLPNFVGAQTAVDPDPYGVLLKPIPDKLIVLTFDDGPDPAVTPALSAIERTVAFCAPPSATSAKVASTSARRRLSSASRR